MCFGLNMSRISFESFKCTPFTPSRRCISTTETRFRAAASTLTKAVESLTPHVWI
jgi:hypothetical protein